jgi:multiple sugar transport system substrate-binding protein
VFADSKNKRRAKEFVTFLLQDENLIPYVEGLARPLVPGDASRAPRGCRSGWPTRTARRCRSSSRPARARSNSPRTTSSPILNNENVWAKAVNRVVSEKWPVEKAVDEMISRIKEVAGKDVG